MSMVDSSNGQKVNWIDGMMLKTHLHQMLMVFQ